MACNLAMTIGSKEVNGREIEQLFHLTKFEHLSLQVIIYIKESCLVT